MHVEKKQNAEMLGSSRRGLWLLSLLLPLALLPQGTLGAALAKTKAKAPKGKKKPANDDDDMLGLGGMGPPPGAWIGKTHIIELDGRLKGTCRCDGRHLFHYRLRI